MKKIHFANLFFEEELLNHYTSISEYLQLHPVFLQLQYLPFLYSAPSHSILVSEKPKNNYLKRLKKLNIYQEQPIYTFKDVIPAGFALETWGTSKIMEKFAQEHSLTYDTASWETSRIIHSKLFNIAKNSQARIFYTVKDLNQWLKTSTFPKVLKAPISLSGRGHLLLSNPEDLTSTKLKRFLSNNAFPIRGEKWLRRILDFSSQWKIEKDQTVHLLGLTKMENTPNGKYRGTLVGEKTALFKKELTWIQKHEEIARNLLKEIAKMGFFGFLGIDAFLYKNEEEKIELYPIVEINARKTMSLCALLLAKKMKVPFMSFRFEHFSKNTEGLLPFSIKNPPTVFHHQLKIYS